MRDLTTGQEIPVGAEDPGDELRRQRDPPAACHKRKIVLTIGGRRYELTMHTEVREIGRGPAKLIEMPGPPTIEP